VLFRTRMPGAALACLRSACMPECSAVNHMPLFPRAAGRSHRHEYRKLVTALARRAERIGAPDPEGAAQEAVERSLAHPLSRAAVEYYFSDPLDQEHQPPGWSLLQLLGWLHGVLRFVVREELARTRREVAPAEMPDVIDPAGTPLEYVINAELHGIVQEALSTLNADHRSALLLRLQGERYVDIAQRLGVNENTVATWIRRGSKALVEYIQQRMSGAPASGPFLRNVAGASHG
jgi:RNA polymerase sigma factor (sigma-70 family)